MRITRFIIYFMLILLLGGVLLVANDFALAYSGRLCRGLVIAGVPVGGLQVGEAERRIAAALRDRHAKPVATLKFEDKHWNVGWDAVVEHPDAARLVSRAYSVGRKGSLPQRLQDQFVANHGGEAVPLGLTANTEKLDVIVAAAAADVDREAVDATLRESPTGVHIIEDERGRRTDAAATVRSLEMAIARGGAAVVSLVVKTIPAAIRTQDLQGMDGMVSAFSTPYDASDESRSHNIRIAAARLNGVLVKSGEVFSFNDRVGLRTSDRGYRKAPTLANTGVVMDWGGGVCQVSSTLYNAALLADFSAVERSAHFQPPVYVPLGQDATVADGQIDLKIKNMRKHAVYFQSIAEAGKLEVRIYGKREKGAPTVHLESTEKTVRIPRTIMQLDPTLPQGEEIVDSAGRNGFVVKVYRIRLEGFKEISREEISTDEFEGADRVVRVGTLNLTGGVAK